MEEFMQLFAKMVAKEVVELLNKPEDELIPRKEALNMLGISEETMWRWQADGTLHPIKKGRKVYFKKSELYGTF